MNSDNAFFIAGGADSTDNAGKSSNHPKQNTSKPFGRFAPSPTGPLHFGSLIAATASYLAAKTKTHGNWLLRIEDVDTGRTQKGATDAIIHTLESYGFEWDGDITYQSQRSVLYEDALESIRDQVYPCSCTRKSLMASSANYSYIYPGFCRGGVTHPDATNLSMRVRTDQTVFSFTDQCQTERFSQNINKAVGDFIVKRSDGLWAYQLAVVVDDALQGVTEVVRGADLFDNTPRQIFLQQLLGYPTPEYLHFPVVVDDSGKKFSKQNASREVSHKQKRETLLLALEFLGQNPPTLEAFSSLDDLWAWALAHWNPNNIPKCMSQPFSNLKTRKNRGGGL